MLKYNNAHAFGKARPTVNGPSGCNIDLQVQTAFVQGDDAALNADRIGYPLFPQVELGFVGAHTGVAEQDQVLILRNFPNAPAQLILGNVDPAVRVFFCIGVAVLPGAAVEDQQIAFSAGPF